MIRRIGNSTAAALRSRALRTVAIFLLGVGALAGTGGLVIAQGHQERDKAHLQSEVAAARHDTAQVKAQLNDVTGEQECRAQLSANASVLSGRILSGIAQLLVALSGKDVPSETQAIELFRMTAPALSAALDAQKNAVATCRNATHTPAPVTTGTVPAPTTTTTVPAARRPATSTTRRPTTTTLPPATSTTSTTFYSSSTTVPTPCTGITLPGGSPCL